MTSRRTPAEHQGGADGARGHVGSPDQWAAALWSSGVPRRALAVALVVGTVLNLINQGDAVWHGALNWPKAILTYLVPFAVSMHGALSTKRSAS